MRAETNAVAEGSGVGRAGRRLRGEEARGEEARREGNCTHPVHIFNHERGLLGVERLLLVAIAVAIATVAARRSLHTPRAG